jgi:hypothetical protein
MKFVDYKGQCCGDFRIYLYADPLWLIHSREHFSFPNRRQSLRSAVLRKRYKKALARRRINAKAQTEARVIRCTPCFDSENTKIASITMKYGFTS